MIVCGRGDTAQHSDRSPASQQASQSFARLGAEAGRSIAPLLIPSHSQFIFICGVEEEERIVHLDGARPHPRTAFRLMERDIRKNVRECVRSSEKVRLDLRVRAVRVRACLGVRAAVRGLWKMKHQGGRRVDTVLSLGFDCSLCSHR